MVGAHSAAYHPIDNYYRILLKTVMGQSQKNSA
jgi:hypothetical protein